MTSPRRKLISGNWKMNGLKSSAGELSGIIAGKGDLVKHLDLMICPPAPLISAFAALARGSQITIGAQDCHAESSGAHTGDISAEMLVDAGATAVITGHSERRADHGETDEIVRAKTLAAKRAGLIAIVCVGETRAERDAGKAMEIVGNQLAGSLPDAIEAARVVVAYEPVWAIGTGLTPTVADVADMHAFIRKQLTGRFESAGEGVRILYGGSVKPQNARELLSIDNVDGALVGGASLKASDFLGIAQACPVT